MPAHSISLLCAWCYSIDECHTISYSDTLLFDTARLVRFDNPKRGSAQSQVDDVNLLIA